MRAASIGISVNIQQYVVVTIAHHAEQKCVTARFAIEQRRAQHNRARVAIRRAVVLDHAAVERTAKRLRRCFERSAFDQSGAAARQSHVLARAGNQAQVSLIRIAEARTLQAGLAELEEDASPALSN